MSASKQLRYHFIALTSKQSTENEGKLSPGLLKEQTFSIAMAY